MNVISNSWQVLQLQDKGRHLYLLFSLAETISRMSKQVVLRKQNDDLDFSLNLRSTEQHYEAAHYAANGALSRNSRQNQLFPS